SRLEREGDVWKLTDLKGIMGRSDLNGALTFDLSKERKYIDADLVSKRLDYRDVGFLIGVPVEVAGADLKTAGGAVSKEKQPATPQKPTEPAETVQKVDKPKAPKRVLPDAPLSVKQVRETDAKVKFRGEQVEAPNVPLSGVQLDLDLKDGILHMKPLQVGVAGGTAIADIKINAQKEPVRTDYDVKLRGFQLGDFLTKAGLENGGKGRIDGRIRLAGTGDTVAKSLGASNGDIRLVINQGEMSNLAVEAAGLDIAEALGLLVTKDKPVGIRCFVADLGVNNGVASPRLFVLDTTDSTILVEGPLDLRSEQMDLRVKTQPKDPSIFAVRTPITVKGTFAEPNIGVDKGALAARGAAAIALGALLTPIGSILAFIEPGLGKDSDCVTLVNEVQVPANVKTPDKIEAPQTASPGSPGRKPDFIPRR
ncbi:MAG: AsmA family protein, partial [Rhodospirillales bacterium]|nr:AsmA family protein [Rhodospirillales bacterium]